MLRQNSIASLVSFIESGQIDVSGEVIASTTEALLVVVKEYTRGFKDSNVNIMKSILSLFIAVCEYHESKEVPPSLVVVKDATDTAVQKISDKKLTLLSKQLLTALCVIAPASEVLTTGFASVKTVKSPIAHEEYLVWCQSFCNDFGAHTIGSSISDMVPFLLEV